MLFEEDEGEVVAGGGTEAAVVVGEGAGLAGETVASPLVPGDEGVADIDDGHLDGLRAVVCGVGFGGGEELAAEAGVLLIGRDGE